MATRKTTANESIPVNEKVLNLDPRASREHLQHMSALVACGLASTSMPDDEIVIRSVNIAQGIVKRTSPFFASLPPVPPVQTDEELVDAEQ